jgi:hypothetical protein
LTVSDVSRDQFREVPTEFVGELDYNFDFLASFASKYFAYNADYDIRALLSGLPLPVLTAIYKDRRALWRDWALYYLPGKEFRANDGHKSFAIYDVCQYFNGSLDEVTRKVFGESLKTPIPQTWYEDMRKPLADPRTRARCLRYARDDARAAYRLGVYMLEQMKAVGVPPAALSRPLSSGTLAAGYFGPRLRVGLKDKRANFIAQRGFHGARIEVFRRGFLKKHVWYIDIHSAYPAELARLADPRNLEVCRCSAVRADAVYSLFRCLVEIPSKVFYPPYPLVRPDGSIIYPVGRFQTWLTKDEMTLGLSRDWIRKTTDGIHLCGDVREWDLGIADLYAERKRRPNLSWGVKILLNSLYGKMAQQNDRWFEARTVTTATQSLGGKFVEKVGMTSGTTNYFVAAYITAGVRLRLHRMMEAYTGHVLVAATDGLLLDVEPSALHLSDRLGGWGLAEEGTAVLIIGSGVYSIRTADGWNDRTRGFHCREALYDLAKRAGSRKALTVVGLNAWTLAEHVRRGVPLNVLEKRTKHVNLDFDDKRHWDGGPIRSGRHLLSTWQDSRPYCVFG